MTSFLHSENRHDDEHSKVALDFFTYATDAKQREWSQHYCETICTHVFDMAKRNLFEKWESCVLTSIPYKC